MKSKTKHSIFFKGIVFALAFALTVLCFPMEALFTTYAASALGEDEDYHVLTISDETNGVKTEVNVGGTYVIPDAYIGGNSSWKIGDTQLAGQQLKNESAPSYDAGKDKNNDGVADTPYKVTLDSSAVKVTYYGQEVETQDGTGKKQFEAKSVGTYVITYSYDYTESYKANGAEDVTKKLTNSYDLEVVSTLSKASVNFNFDNVSLVPSDQTSVIDYSIPDALEADGSLKDVKILLPEILDENGKKIPDEDITFIAGKEGEKPTDQKTESAEKVVLITANGGNLAEDVEIKGEGKDFYIDAEIFKQTNFGEGTYTLKFNYYVRSENGEYNFVTANTKSFTVYGVPDASGNKSKNTYYDNYKLDISLESEWVDNGETGVEHDIPKPIGLTSDDTKPENERVNVSYRVKVFYKKNLEDTYEEISTIKVKDDQGVDTDELLYKDVLDMTNPDDTFTYGTLQVGKSTSFKPLQDGYYSFIYTVKDIFGNTASNSNGRIGYQYLGTNRGGVKDSTKPTPIVYDAFVKMTDYEKEIKDEDFKSRTYATANSVVVYAIGMKDNHSKHDDKDVEMSRRVTYDGVHQFTIEDFDEFNLVFNYRAKGEIEAWEGLVTNNFNIRRVVEALGLEEKIDSDVKMLAWLAKNGYKIVVDDANYETIFNIFNAKKGDKVDGKDVVTSNEASLFDGKTLEDQSITAENFRDWAKSEEGANAGFAYIEEMDKTFGYSDSLAKDETKGLGLGTFKIEYIVKDAAGNEASKSINITLEENAEDPDAPTLNFKTSLKAAYLPTDVVTFDAPTSTDYRDTRMNEIVLYRYLGADDKPIELYKADEDGKPTQEKRETVSLDELWKYLDDEWDDNNVELQTKYGKYRTKAADLEEKYDDKYFDITDPDAETYSIDLNEVKKFAVDSKTASKLQILTYVYDDEGHPAIYAETIEIPDAVDNHKPKLLTKFAEDTKTYYRGEEIALADLEFADDAVQFMNYDVKVTYSNEGTTTEVPVFGGSQERLGMALKYVVHPGSFVASHAGDYQVTIKVRDSKNNTIVHFQTFHVLPRTLVQPPQINSTLAKTQTIEIQGDSNYDPAKGIELPTPTISYDIPNSVTYDVYSANKSQYEEDPNTQYVVLGVKENGAVDQDYYSVSEGDENNIFRPKELGEYKIKYTVYMRAFDLHKFTLNDKPSYDGNTYKEGGTLTYKNGPSENKASNVTVEFTNENNTFLIHDGNQETVYKAIIDNSKMEIYKDGVIVPEQELKSTMFGNEKVVEEFRTLRNYVLESEIYRVNVVDTQAPVIRDYSAVYPTQMSKKALQEAEKILIYGIQPDEENKARYNDIDVSKCSIVVYYTLPNGKEGGRVEKTGAEAFKDFDYTEFPSTIHATYTIRYTVWDKNNNSDTSHVYTFTVGDVEAPKITVPENFIKDSYEIGVTKELKIDLGALTISDKGVDEENKEAEANGEEKFVFKPTATLVNKTTNETIEGESEDGLLFFYPLNNVGSYELTIEVQDSVGNTARQVFKFEVVSRTTDTTMTYQVIGTVLIVISVLVLAGVIIYFIVSKVKLDKELKK